MFGISLVQTIQRVAEARQNMIDMDAKGNEIGDGPKILEFNQLLAGKPRNKPELRSYMNIPQEIRHEPEPIDFLYKRGPFGESVLGIRSFYRNEELTEGAIEAGFDKARDSVDIMQAKDACRASPYFTERQCSSMAIAAILKSYQTLNIRF